MDAAKFGIELAKARGRLVESVDFAALHERGHELTDGAVLTSVSDLPFEMSFRCMRCSATFWFENLAWRTGGLALWRLSDESRDRADHNCGAPAGVAARLGNRQGAVLKGV